MYKNNGAILLGWKPICEVVPVEGKDIPDMMWAKEDMRSGGMDVPPSQQLVSEPFGPACETV
eukprot:779716-Pyramimonas_sp.AAC.1